MSKTNRRLYLVAAVTVATFGLTLAGHAQTTNVLVNDTWRDGDRTNPASPVYAENNGVVGTDADADGDLESAWFHGGSGTLAIVTNNPPITGPNLLEETGQGASSSSIYTYFTQPGTPVTLANPGDALRLVWQFIPTGVNASNTSQGFNIALAQTPNGARPTGDASVPNTNYTGLAMFMNMGTQLNNGNAFQLLRWNLGATPGNLLGTAGNWAAQTNGVGKLHGYDNGTQYTLTMVVTRDASGNLIISNSMVGGTYAGTGTGVVNFVDTAPATDGAGYTFDTFDLRPTAAGSAATTIDTTLFHVEFITVPEPSTVALVGGGLGLLIAMIRRRRS